MSRILSGPSISRGWSVLGASAVIELLVQGATSYSAGLFVLPLQAEFHISRADANSTVSILFLGTMLLSPVAGRILDQLPLRQSMTLGVVAFCGGFGIISQILRPWMMALVLLAPCALGFMLLGPLNTSTIAARLFFRNRGLAMGVAAVATSGGGFVVTPLLARAIDAWGWREGLLIEAVLIGAVVVALTAFFIRETSPASKHKNPHESFRQPLKLRDAWIGILKDRAFWPPGVALAVIASVSQAVMVTLVPYGTELGLPPIKAASAIPVFAVCAAVTKVVAGILSDRISRRTLLILATTAAVMSQIMLWLASSKESLYAGSALMGIALGFVLPTAGSMIAECFGAAAFGTVMGLAYMFAFGLAILASRFSGYSYDRYHSYSISFIVFMSAAAIALLVTAVTSPKAFSLRKSG